MHISSHGPKFGLSVHITGGVMEKIHAVDALKGNGVPVNAVQDNLDDVWVGTGSTDEARVPEEAITFKASDLNRLLWEDEKTPDKFRKIKQALLEALNA